jgi:hypothetical protein
LGVLGAPKKGSESPRRVLKNPLPEKLVRGGVPLWRPNSLLTGKRPKISSNLSNGPATPRLRADFFSALLVKFSGEPRKKASKPNMTYDTPVAVETILDHGGWNTIIRS